MSKSITYISSQKYLDLCDKHPKTVGRASVIHSLVVTYNLLEGLHVIPPVAATLDELQQFHSEEYINRLQRLQERFHDNDSDEEDDDNKLEDYGLGYDCAVFPEIFDYVRYVAGASITAARLLSSNSSDVVINLNGGWHHAHVDEAAGFCYVNDIVLCILELLKSFKRVMYVDLDIHHGDGVEEAFKYSKKVMTFSIHKHGAGFFPGTGCKNSFKYNTINIPLKDGLADDKYIYTFQTLFQKAFDVFQPSVIVTQCGADCLSGDPLGGFNLTSNALTKCVEIIMATDTPLVILGGGGYNIANTARCWTEVIACLTRTKLHPDIPEHDYLYIYKPDYSLPVTKSNRKDENNDEDINDVIKDVTSVLHNFSLTVIPNMGLSCPSKDMSDRSENDILTNKVMVCPNKESCDRKENELNVKAPLKRDFIEEEINIVSCKKILVEKNHSHLQ